MNYTRLTIILLITASNLCAQAVKKTAVSKQTVPAKTSQVLMKLDFLRRNLLLDTTLFSATVEKTDTKQELVVKSKQIPGASITLSDATASTVTELRTVMDDFFDKNSIVPTKSGFTYVPVGISTTLQHEGRTMEPVEYKAVFKGTEAQRRNAAALNSMPKARTMVGDKIVESKPVNEFDNDANNRIVRMYFLNYAPDIDKGFMLLYYEANFGEDRRNEGGKLLQTLVSGLSRMKITEKTKFAIVKEPKLNMELAIPAFTGSDGYYDFEKPERGRIKISAIADATGGYAAIIDNARAYVGTATVKTPVEKHTLYNGIKIFSSIHTMERKDDDGYTSVWYDYLTVLVPDNKLIKKPILIRLTLYSTDPVERDELNAFILNSISAPGKLTPASFDKLQVSFVKP